MGYNVVNLSYSIKQGLPKATTNGRTLYITNLGNDLMTADYRN
jgi:hypothetical protein